MVKNITIPYIEGDGIGKEITKEMIRVVDSAISITNRNVDFSDNAPDTDTGISIDWKRLQAGECALAETGAYLPESTLEEIRRHGLAIKGPLTTPVGKGFRSLNVQLRKEFDLYACVRPVRYFEGVESVMKNPEKINLVVFRENTEDIYSGIEFENQTEDSKKLENYLTNQLGVTGIRFPETSAYGIKVVSEQGSERLIRSAFEYARTNGLKKVSLVHKGNIMKYTEGMFKSKGYEVAKEFPDIEVDDYICDNFLQQLVLDPSKFSVVATLNLNGDYISDTAAAEVGGIGIAPGANINYATNTAIFEATHGAAPDIANQNIANPASILLSAVMMLKHLGLSTAGELIEQGIEQLYKKSIFTYDLDKNNYLSTTDWTDALIKEIDIISHLRCKKLRKAGLI
jgi:isocitrate dehydrogenase